MSRASYLKFVLQNPLSCQINPLAYYFSCNFSANKIPHLSLAAQVKVQEKGTKICLLYFWQPTNPSIITSIIIKSNVRSQISHNQQNDTLYRKTRVCNQLHAFVCYTNLFNDFFQWNFRICKWYQIMPKWY